MKKYILVHHNLSGSDFAKYADLDKTFHSEIVTTKNEFKAIEKKYKELVDHVLTKNSQSSLLMILRCISDEFGVYIHANEIKE